MFTFPTETEACTGAGIIVIRKFYKVFFFFAFNFEYSSITFGGGGFDKFFKTKMFSLNKGAVPFINFDLCS
jgi:hypothetical protein